MVAELGLAAIGAAGQALQGFGQAAPSAARADSYQAGVNSPFGANTVISSGNVYASQGRAIAPLQTDLTQTPPVTTNAGVVSQETLLWILLGGAVLWLMLKK